MLQVRPTFSESWYRVAPLRAKLRPSAQISRQFYRGERWYVVRDPAGNQFHRLSDAAYRFVGLLDGRRTVEEAWDLVGGQLADDAPTQPEVIHILSQLYAANLIEADITPDATVLLRRHKQQVKQRMQGRLMNVLFPRIPLWDPDRFLKRWMPVMKWFLSPLGAALWIIVVGLGVGRIAPMWAELQASAKDAINPSNWLWLWGVFVAIKLIHELGHAFTCRRFGGEVHELGIMFLVFIPTPYVDASTAWGFPSKWARTLVGAGGMIFELFVAAILAFVWSETAPGTLIHQLSYNAMLIASVSTVIFNANPLLRYDGYYILSDLIEIPNLRQRSVEYALGLIKRHIFRVKSPIPLPPPGQRVWLLFYAITSSIYRTFVGVMIILLVAYKVPVLGMLMAIGGLVTWAVVPVSKMAKYLLLEPELHRKRGRASLFTGAVAAAVIILIGVIPFPVHYEATGVLEPTNREVLNARVGGFVREVGAGLRDGSLVHKGDVLIKCSNPDLEANVLQLRAKIEALRAHRMKAMVGDQNLMQADDEQLKNLLQQLADSEADVAELTIRSPIDGRLIAPGIEQQQGRYIPVGAEVATVATMEKLVTRAALEQQEAQLAALKYDPAPEVRVAGQLSRVITGYGTKLIDGAQKELPHASLGNGGGGTIATDPHDPKGTKPAMDQFEIQVTLDNPDQLLVPGQRAYLRFTLDKRPLVWQWTRRIYQLIQTENMNATASKSLSSTF
jgi:putative peptide zinc metalloprotease protein